MLHHIMTALWLPLVLQILIKKRVTTVQWWICFAINYLAFLLAQSWIADTGEIGLIFVLLIILIVCSKGLKCKKIEYIYIPTSYILISLINNMVTFIIEQIYHISSKEIYTEPYLFYCEIAITIISFLSAMLLRKILEYTRILMDNRYQKVAIILIGGNVLLCMIIFLINNWAARVNHFPSVVEGTNLLIFCVYTFLLIFITVITLKMFHDKEQMEREKQQYENLKEYSAQIETMYTNLRAFKHDYINILTVMSGYFNEKNYEGLEKYFNENILTTREKLEKDNYRLNQLKNIKDLALKGLISSKIIYAHEMGIDVYIDIMEPIEHIAMKEIDLSRVLGIFLDNAIEAALETETKEIKFGMVKEDTVVAVIVMNTFINHNIPVAKLEQEGVSTKGENRGLGLANVKEILQLYSNVYKTTEIREKYFLQKLEIVM